MITRDQYMENSSDLHHAYYSQFVTPAIKAGVVSAFGLETLKKQFKKDPWLNGIALRRWDAIARLAQGSATHDLMKAAGAWLTLADCTCILKAAARIAIEE